MTNTVKDIENYFIHASVNSIDDLKAIDTSLIQNATIVTVSQMGVFQFQTPEISTPDDRDVISPTIGGGAWIRQTVPELITTVDGRIAALMLSLTLDGLDDTVISGLLPGQILKYNGTNWYNSNSTNTPGPLSDLTDVSISSPTNGNFLVYNSTISKWENIVVNIPQSLEDLTDVSIIAIANNNVLTWDSISSNWINLPAQPVYFALENLTNVTLTSLANNQVLTWNAIDSSWENADTQSVPTTFSSLTDVSLTSLQSGQIIYFNGSFWVNTDYSSLIYHNSLNGLEGGDITHFEHLGLDAYNYLKFRDQSVYTSSDVSFKSQVIESTTILANPTSKINVTNSSSNGNAQTILNSGTGRTLSISNTQNELNGTAHSKTISTNAGDLLEPVNSSLKIASFGCASPDNNDVALGITASRNLSYGHVNSLSVNNIGSTYQSYDWVNINGGNNDAKAQIIASGGNIDSANIILSGSGYSNATDNLTNTPSTNGVGCTIDITTSTEFVITATPNLPGTGYLINDKLSIIPTLPPMQNCQLLVSSIDINGGVTGLTVFYAGNGYEDSINNDSFGYTGIGSNGTLNVTASNSIDGISIKFGIDGGNITNAGGEHLIFNSDGSSQLNGNSSTATALQNARTINGVSFNGTSNITIPFSETPITITADSNLDSSTMNVNQPYEYTNNGLAIVTLTIIGGSTLRNPPILNGSSTTAGFNPGDVFAFTKLTDNTILVS